MSPPKAPNHSWFNPDPVLVLIGLAVALVTTAFQLWSVGQDAKRQSARAFREAKAEAATQNLRMVDSEPREKKLIRVDQDIYVAVGYGFANCILVEGPTGCVVIGSTVSEAIAIEVLGAFSTVTSKPIQGMILTHFCLDVCGGVQTFCKLLGKGQQLEIFAHELFCSCQSAAATSGGSSLTRKKDPKLPKPESEDEKEKTNRTNKRWGSPLEPLDPVTPTCVVKDHLTVKIGGLTLELLHSPGESKDHLIIWWPQKKTLFAGDNIYQSFPLVDPVGLGGDAGGQMSTDCLVRLKALDLMSSLEPEVLIPQHSRPLVNKNEIRDTIQAYRDAIQFVHDQTVRYLSQGLPFDDIADRVRLPDGLRDHPFLQETYGTVSWAVRAVHEHYDRCSDSKASTNIYLRRAKQGESMGNPKDDSTTWTEELILGSSSPSEVLTLLTTCLDPSEVVLSNCNSLRFKLKLTDLDMEQEFEVRNGILYVGGTSFLSPEPVEITSDFGVWKSLLVGQVALQDEVNIHTSDREKLQQLLAAFRLK